MARTGELSKRPAEALGIPCYDHQIIDMVAEKENMSKEYVAHMSEKDMRVFYPTTISRGFSTPNYTLMQSAQIAAAEHNLIKQLAAEGDCVIIGRAADAVLREMEPFSIFVCANEESKLARCKSRAKDGENPSDKDILGKCKEIDKHRRTYREMYCKSKCGEVGSFDLYINTSGKEIKTLVPALAGYIKAWYEA